MVYNKSVYHFCPLEYGAIFSSYCFSHTSILCFFRVNNNHSTFKHSELAGLLKCMCFCYIIIYIPKNHRTTKTVTNKFLWFTTKVSSILPVLNLYIKMRVSKDNVISINPMIFTSLNSYLSFKSRIYTWSLSIPHNQIAVMIIFVSAMWRTEQLV